MVSVSVLDAPQVEKADRIRSASQPGSQGFLPAV